MCCYFRHYCIEVLLFVHSQVFPDAVESHNLSTDHLLQSTLHITHTSHNHTGTYHCNIVDGTNEGELATFSSLCANHPCHPFITASNPATITVLGRPPLSTVSLKTFAEKLSQNSVQQRFAKKVCEST